MFKRHHLFMASAAAMLSAGAAAVASAYPEDGKLRVRNVDSEQECTFDDRAQLDAFLANVEFPDAWQLQGKPAALELEQLDTSATEAATPIVTINLDLEQLRAGASPADAVSATAAAPAADPAPAPAATEAPAAETPAAAAPAAPKARKTTTKA